MFKTSMIVGMTHLLLMTCDAVRNSSQAPTNGGTAVNNPPMCSSTDVNYQTITSLCYCTLRAVVNKPVFNNLLYKIWV